MSTLTPNDVVPALRLTDIEVNKTLKYLLIPVATIAATLLPASAAPAEHYAASSVLSQGKWARVKVSASGMHLVTDADMRSLGFSDPSKVRVYGTGGQAVDDCLNASTPDDLPLLPSVRTQQGLLFFGVDHFKWGDPSRGTGVPYSHTIHPYNDDSYYFLSDRELTDSVTMSSATLPKASGEVITDFMARTVHETELDHPGESGFIILGEDFRTNSAQSFKFNFPDMVDGEAKLLVRFGAKTTNGTSTLMFTANGEALPSSASDRINAVTSKEYVNFTSTVKTVEKLDGSLDFGIKYNYTGALFTARLDYIEAFYRRRLAIRDGEIYFYGNFASGDSPSIAGCTAETVIWDVTVPSRPLPVEFSLEGDKAVFSITDSGYREFVAFNPSAVTRKTVNAGGVANQDLHSLPTPDMVIITLPEYRDGAARIGKLHEEVDSMRVHVIDADLIYNEFSGGKPDFGAFRKLMKMWYDRGVSDDGHSIRYALLMGKPSYDNKMVSANVKNAGYKPMLIYQSMTGLSETTSFSNDDYIGMLEDCEPGRFTLSTAKVNVAVGRLPVTDTKEANEMAAKIEKYVKTPNYGAWRNKVMIIADDDDNSQHFNQAQDVYRAMRSKGAGADYVYDRVYLDSWQRVNSSIGPTYPQATERMMKNYNDGVLITNYIGHASPKGWGHEHLWEWKDIISMTNPNLTFLYAATCGFAFWDGTDMSGAEHLMLNPTAGVIGMMAATRTVYISMNGVLNRKTSTHFFERDADGYNPRFGDVYIKGKNEYSGDTNKLRYAFMGDPAIRIPGGRYYVNITKVNGESLGASNEKPVLPALGTAVVEGSILNYMGQEIPDFNGTVNLKLYDAERVITTYGQGNDGKVETYNDRKTVLTTVSAKVTDGKWKAILRLPPEIEGNFSPALISGYAWDAKGREANGSTDNIYVYGYNEDAATDSIGPKVEYFYVNYPEFESGALVNSNPVVFARFSDESGINISEGGLGHSITLSIDGKTTYSDLNGYFESDLEDADAGSIIYPLSGIEAGRHELILTVWDNAGNLTRSHLDINVGAAVDPVIRDITTGRADEAVVFNILLDRPNTALDCRIEVFNLLGRKVWEYSQNASTDINSTLSAQWDLRDSSGIRVPRGIYVYKATVETPEGTYSSKSKKLAVAAQ